LAVREASDVSIYAHPKEQKQYGGTTPTESQRRGRDGVLFHLMSIFVNISFGRNSFKLRILLGKH
jgi:hypothetical protein